MIEKIIDSLAGNNFLMTVIPLALLYVLARLIQKLQG